MWPFKRKSSNISQIALDICEAFRHGKLVKRDIDRRGISALSIDYLGERVEISWYSSGRLREFSVGGKGTIGSNADVDAIFAAAYERACNIAAEDIARLEAKRILQTK